MATHLRDTRFALRPDVDLRPPDGAWWPARRRWGDQLGRHFGFWPPDRSRSARVPCSPPDGAVAVRPSDAGAEQEPAWDSGGDHH
jgi:hypothetical protein